MGRKSLVTLCGLQQGELVAEHFIHFSDLMPVLASLNQHKIKKPALFVTFTSISYHPQKFETVLDGSDAFDRKHSVSLSHNTQIRPPKL